jgi:hypothetical protein
MELLCFTMPSKDPREADATLLRRLAVEEAEAEAGTA